MYIVVTFNDDEEVEMKAAVFREVGQPLTIEDIQISKPGPREVLVRTAAVGVCHSDLHFIEGLYPAQTPMILGHESAGIVEQVGSDVSYLKPGDHVISCLSVFCGHCFHTTSIRPLVQSGILQGPGNSGKRGSPPPPLTY